MSSAKLTARVAAGSNGWSGMFGKAVGVRGEVIQGFGSQSESLRKNTARRG